MKYKYNYFKLTQDKDYVKSLMAKMSDSKEQHKRRIAMAVEQLQKDLEQIKIRYNIK